MKQKVAVVGAKGKMGSEVVKVLLEDFDVIQIDIGDSIEEAKDAKVIIDFGGAKSSVISAEFAKKQGLALIVGSTGQSEEELKQIRSASSSIPILICSNFSVGIYIEKKISDLILKYVNPEITILEKHHNQKKDAPSGTAIELMQNIKVKTGEEVPILSERGGKEIGTHKIDFYFGDELVSVSHSAFSRGAFSRGVLLATKYMINQTIPKEYHFNDVLENQL